MLFRYTPYTKNHNSSVYLRKPSEPNRRLITDTEDSSEWGSLGALLADDSVNYLEGSQSVGITKNNDTLTYLRAWYRTGSIQSWNNYNYLDFNFRIVDKTNLNIVGVTLHAGPGDEVNYLAKYFIPGEVSTGWNNLVIPEGDFTVNGAGSWGTIGEFRVGVAFSTDAITRVFNVENVYIEK